MSNIFTHVNLFTISEIIIVFILMFFRIFIHMKYLRFFSNESSMILNDRFLSKTNIKILDKNWYNFHVLVITFLGTIINLTMSNLFINVLIISLFCYSLIEIIKYIKLQKLIKDIINEQRGVRYEK